MAWGAGDFGGNSDERLVRAVALPWFEILEMFRRDPRSIYEVDWRRWEEIIAGAYQKAGFDEVILTPRSGDGGRDVIATMRHRLELKPREVLLPWLAKLSDGRGIGSIRIFDQVKAYKPGHLATAEKRRAMLGVIQAQNREEPLPSPPRTAKFLLYCCPKKYRENLIGDLEEEYNIVLRDCGPRHAWVACWSQVIWSLAPLVWSLLVRSTFVTAAAGVVSWLWQKLGH